MMKIIHFQFNLCTKLRNSFQSIVLELSLSTERNKSFSSPSSFDIPKLANTVLNSLC